ncbi:Fatty acyl-CoA reductase 2 [Camellia lanceoleosa]|uniref:Fatty acyl-CoA reductase 2 n=1 Tax=Camellia lanceoleosa TaxID=1840588 RepID=A0ACC0F7W4_9ERIC|nr:Fatty acyl-CoA reductase 2 [Camellia lanceoleosa]
MGALPLNFFSIRPENFIKWRDEHSQCLIMIRKKSALYCHADHVAPLDYGGRPVLSPNGMNRAESAAKELELCSGIGIVKFFREKFLVTGATGFLAKVLVKKIPRTVPDVDRIYLIIKAENKEAATERLKDELFKRLQQTYGESYQDFMLSKLVPVVGNVCKDNPALEEDVADAIKNEVDVIINFAANTNFDERLLPFFSLIIHMMLLHINTKGPSNLMSFAKKCKKIKLFLHVSTAYVNGERQGRIMEKPMCIRDSIAEESSTSAVDVENEMKLVLNSKKCLEDKAVTPKMKELGMERTHVFTKAMEEMLIDGTRGDIPLVIIRPSVIGSTDKEPFPGWIEGNRMADPLIRLHSKGQLSGFPGDPNGVLDAVPADFVVNAILAATAKHET